MEPRDELGVSDPIYGEQQFWFVDGGWRAKRSRGFLLLFLASGLFLRAVVHMPKGWDSYRPYMIALSVALIFQSLLLLFVRRGIDFDLHLRTYRRIWRFLLPFRGWEGSLDQFNALILVRPPKSEPPVYNFHLQRQDGTTLELGGYGSYRRAKRAAEEMARLLKFPFRDDALRAAALKSATGPPARLQAGSESGERTVGFVIPRGGWSVGAVGLLFPAILVGLLAAFPLAMILVEMVQNPEPLSSGSLMFCGILVLVNVLCFRFAWMILYGVISTTWALEASPEALRIFARGRFGKKTVEMPADSIAEIGVLSTTGGWWAFCSGGFLKPLLVRSDDRTVSFGFQLRMEEKRWIAGRIRRVLGLDPPE